MAFFRLALGFLVVALLGVVDFLWVPRRLGSSKEKLSTNTCLLGGFIPADPAQVAAYLAERIQEHGHKPATLRVAAAAIAFAHKTVKADDPCASPEVKRTLRCATRKAGRDQKQAEALTEEALAAIESTACEPRPGRGGRYESEETARCRGNLDIALIRLMRDAMLRVSEAAALTWRDVKPRCQWRRHVGPLWRRESVPPRVIGQRSARVRANCSGRLENVARTAEAADRVGN